MAHKTRRKENGKSASRETKAKHSEKSGAEGGRAIEECWWQCKVI